MSMQEERCEKCGKRIYTSWLLAKADAHRLSQQSGEPMSAYWSRKCGGKVHIGRSSKRSNPRLVR